MLLLVGVAALLLGAAVAWITHSLAPSTGAASVPGLLWPPPRTLGEFSVVDHLGQPFDAQRLDGKWSLLFFGFTNCPDVCPNTLRTLQKAVHRLPADTQVVFVSVDPERDTLEKLAGYVSYFHPAFIGVTGTPAAVDGITRQLGAMHMRAAGGDAANYNVDHTASIFLIDPRRQMVGVFSQPITADTLVSAYNGVRRFIEKQKS